MKLIDVNKEADGIEKQSQLPVLIEEAMEQSVEVDESEKNKASENKKDNQTEDESSGKPGNLISVFL